MKKEHWAMLALALLAILMIAVGIMAYITRPYVEIEGERPDEGKIRKEIESDTDDGLIRRWRNLLGDN